MPPTTAKSSPRSSAHSSAHPFGIDFGGSGIKGAPVDLSSGEFAAERTRIETPEGGRPEAVADVVARLVAEGAATSPAVGITVPGVVVRGVVRTAANIDKAWIGTDAVELFKRQLDRDVVVVNDADAAGLAEARFGAARGKQGLVVVTTLGTGIGTALVYDGVLVPNSELGHVEIGGKDAETQAANSVREKKELSWKEWRSGSTATTRPSRRCSPPTSSWSAVAGASTPAGTCRSSNSRPRSSRRRCATRPGSWAPPYSPPRHPTLVERALIPVERALIPVEPAVMPVEPAVIPVEPAPIPRMAGRFGLAPGG